MSSAAEQLRADDAAARHAAADTSRSILLQAPAGSGKTTVLVNRYLKLLSQVEQPEQVLAITFTRKAAAEMRTRVLAALRAAASGASDALTGEQARAALKNSANRGWQLAINPARLRITTIDSVCHALVATNPVQSGGGAGAKIAADARGLYRRAADQCLRDAASAEPLRAALELWLQRLDNQWERLAALIAGMLDRRAEWLPRLLGGNTPDLADTVNAAATRLVNATLAGGLAAIPGELMERGSALATELAALSATTHPWRDTVGMPQAEMRDLPRWQWLAHLLLTGKDEWRQKPDARVGVPASAGAVRARTMAWLVDMQRVPGAQTFWRRVRALPVLPMPAIDAAALRALASLLVHAVSELHAVFADQGEVDFTYIAGAARQTLVEGGEPTPVALRTSHELRHLLVDEFQDTSRLQYQLLEALTLGWSPGDGRTLFMVGDPMQSIYLFRQAEVGNFLNVRDRGLGALRLNSLQLRVNFRSDSQLVDWSNTNFTALFPPLDELARSAIRFLPAVAAVTSEPQNPALTVSLAVPAKVQLHALCGQLEEDALSEQEAATVVGIVRDSWRASPTATIAVLIANRRHAEAITAALEAAGIAVRANRVTALVDRATVRDLLALARALQHPDDRVAWLALLRGPYCGLELPELESVVAGSAAAIWSLLHDESRLANLAGPSRQRVARLCAALDPALEGEECRLPLLQRLHHSWLRAGGAALCRHPRELADARACFAALAQRADLERLAGPAFDALLDELYASADRQPTQVELLTIHGAKGLEWDVVIAPSLGRQRQSDQSQLLQSLGVLSPDGEADWLLAPLPDAIHDKERSLAGWLRGLAAERAQLERVRLLYVLATRARRALHLLGHVSERRDGTRLPNRRSLLFDAWAAVAPQFTAALAGSVGVAAGAGASAGGAPSAAPSGAPGAAATLAASSPPGVHRQRLGAVWQAVARNLVTQRLPLPSPTLDDRVEYSWVGQTARAIGTVVHAELQRFSQTAELPAELPPAAHYHSWLAELGVPAAERADAAADVRRALQQVQQDSQGRWLLASDAHREASSEVRLSGMYRGELVNISIDRMLIDQAGTRWVVDYKTNRHEGGELEAFIASEVARYRPQLQRYAALAARLGPEPLRCALYFPLSGIFREVAVY